MNRNTLRKNLWVTGVALGTGLTCGVASAVDFYLCAGATTQVMPDGAPVVVWGYAEDDNANLADGCGGATQSPGPLLNVPPSETTVTVHLRNDLSVDTSLLMPGQSAAMIPDYTSPADPATPARVTSLAARTAPGAFGTYQWNNVKPGSFVYHSGTHMALQVQMGLYGGMKKDFAVGMAYDGVPYDEEAILFYSEIDPLLHAAVADGSYGTPPAPTSTINYQPKYFLVNGAATGDTTLSAASAGQRTLLRFYNMGLRTVAPSVLGQYLKVVAEDGRPYPYAREQYSLMLAAGKSRDAIFTPLSDGSYPLYDRLLNLSSAAAAPGGLYAFLSVGAAAAGTPLAASDSYTVAEDGTLSIAAPGVLGNDSDPDGGTLTAHLASAATQGSVTLNPGGDFSYTPPANFNGSASFSYSASDGVLTSAAATVTISVTPMNDAPLALADSYDATVGSVLNIAAPGVLANDNDVDGDALTASVVSPPASGALVLNADGSFSYTPGTAGTVTFTYVAQDASSSSNVATVTLNVTASTNQAPIANDDLNLTTTIGIALVIPVLANDRDADGTLDPATVVVSGKLKKGNTAVANADGTITYTPRPGFRGTDTFYYTVKDDLGAVSNSAMVRVNVVR